MPKGDSSLVCLFMGGSCRDSQAKGQLISGWGGSGNDPWLCLEAEDHDLGELMSSKLGQGFGYLKH